MSYGSQVASRVCLSAASLCLRLAFKSQWIEHLARVSNAEALCVRGGVQKRRLHGDFLGLSCPKLGRCSQHSTVVTLCLVHAGNLPVTKREAPYSPEFERGQSSAKLRPHTARESELDAEPSPSALTAHQAPFHRSLSCTSCRQVQRGSTEPARRSAHRPGQLPAVKADICTSQCKAPGIARRFDVYAPAQILALSVTVLFH